MKGYDDWKCTEPEYFWDEFDENFQEWLAQELYFKVLERTGSKHEAEKEYSRFKLLNLDSVDRQR
jgi:hypothetical protein